MVVLSLVSRMDISDRFETVLSLESVFDDVLCAVCSLAVIGIIITGQTDSAIIAREIAGQFSIGAVIGAAFGLVESSSKGG